MASTTTTNKMNGGGAANGGGLKATMPMLAGGASSACMQSFLMMDGGCDALYELVELTIRELMTSDRTALCMRQERQRNDARELAVFARVLRDVAHDRRCVRPNMLHIVAQVAFHCRKNRSPPYSSAAPERRASEDIVRQCVDAVAGLLLVHGGTRVARQMHHATRAREFICSMLYLARVGITFQGRQILPRIEALHWLLPLQALLPSVFKIRAKSITEGENLIKMDIKHLPLLP